MAEKAAPAPKFGSWDAENIGYTVFFEKVRENKGTPAPAPAAVPARGDYVFDPYEHYENLSRNAAAAAPARGDYGFDPYEHYENLSRNAPSRPASSQGHGHGPPPHRQAQQRGTGYHRRHGSNGSTAESDASSRASKFSPPRPYQPRYGNNGYPAQHGGGYGAGAGAYAGPATNSYPTQQGVGYGAGAYAAPVPRHHQHAAPRPAVTVAASPPRYAPPPASERAATTKAPSAVPKFGVWDEQNATAVAQGFTVQFEKVKRHREVAKAASPDVLPPPPQQLISPERLPAPAWQRPRRTNASKTLVSKMCGCLFPKVRDGLS